MSKSINGISRNSLIAYLICIFSRLCAILFNDGYLPLDSSGDTIYRASELFSFLSLLILLYLSYNTYKSSYNWELDTFKWYFFAIPTFILAILFHPNLNGIFYADFAWTYALYLESIAMFPQLDVIRKKGGEVENYTSHYVSA